MPTTDTASDILTERVALFPKQAFALKWSNIRELLFGGARGGGKTSCGLFWLIQPPYIYHKDYRALVIRKNVDDLSDWVSRARRIYAGFRPKILGRPPVISFPQGATFVLGHLKDEDAYGKYQGHEYQKVLIEELTQIPREEDYLNLIASCRSTIKGLQPKVFCTANPGGAGMLWVKKRWKIDQIQPNTPFEISGDGRLAMYIPATIDDNPAILEQDPAYARFLDSLPEPMRSAWRYGSWDVIFGSMFDFGRDHIMDPEPPPPNAPLYMTFDWGYSKPFSIGWWWQEQDSGRVYRFHELYGANREKADTGLRWTDDQIAEAIITEEAKIGVWGLPITRYAGHDSFKPKVDYRGQGQAPSTADVFAQHNITLQSVKIDRITKVRQFHLRLRVKRDKEGNALERPMLMVYRTCHDFIRTVPALQPDAVNPEDVDTSLEDHIYDEASQICLARPILVPGVSPYPVAPRDMATKLRAAMRPKEF